jgi:hypothetical protein
MMRSTFLSGDLFSNAVTTLASTFRGVVDLAPTPISLFKARYPNYLDKANRNEVQVISQGSKRYVLLSEEQVIALAEREGEQRSLGDIVRGIETPLLRFAPTSLHSKRARVSQIKLPQVHAAD